VAMMVWIAALARPALAVVYTFGDATLSAKQVEVQLRERVAVATGAPHVTKGDWEVDAKTIKLAFDQQRKPTSIDFCGDVSFHGKPAKGEGKAARPIADALRGTAAAANWVADRGSAPPGRSDQGALTLSGSPHLEALSEGQVAATIVAATIVARLNTGELAAADGAAITRSGSRLRHEEKTGKDVAVTYNAAVNADKIVLDWDLEAQLARSAAATGSVKLLYTSDDPGNGTRTVTKGACDGASWGRDPDWQGAPAEDEGIAVLRGNVLVESVIDDGKPETNDEVAKIVCAKLTYSANQRRTLAEGGPEGQVGLTVEEER
jgi:hypothetical protein